MALIFLQTEFDQTKVNFFNTLSKTFDIKVVYITTVVPKTNKIKYKYLNVGFKKLKLGRKNWLTEEINNLPKTKDVLVIPDTKIPNVILSVFKSIPTKNRILWADRTVSQANKNIFLRFFSNLSAYIRALNVNTIIAENNVSEAYYSKIGLPAAGQRLVTINTPIYTKKELEAIQNTRNNIKNKKITFGFINYFSENITEIVSQAINFYNNSKVEFIISDNTIENENELIKFIQKIDVLICASINPKWGRVIQLAAIFGVPTITIANMPNSNLLYPFSKEVILHDISPIHLAKAFTEVQKAFSDSNKWTVKLNKMIELAHTNSIEANCIEWEKIIKRIVKHEIT